MPLCFSPWTNLDISPQGTISPCCKFQLKYYNERFNVQTHELNTYLSSKFLQSVKDQMSQDIWPQGCERCQIEEQHGIESKRQLDYQRWHQYYKETNNTFITASVAFGNTCNLKCITCNSFASSKWHREYADIYGEDIKPVHFYKQSFVSDFIHQIPELIHLDVPGGEPMLSGVTEQKQLLQHFIDTGKACKISLHYTTNATIFPDSSWLELWTHFREIDIQLSIDGIGDRYEYIRYPAVWDDLEKNVIRYVELEQSVANLRLSVSHTVSAYNIFYLDEFFSWCYSIGLSNPWLGRVHNPMHMRPTVWPDKKFIIDQLEQSQYPDIKNWIELLNTHDDSEHFETFKTKVVEHDNYRGTDFSKVFPELKL